MASASLGQGITDLSGGMAQAAACEEARCVLPSPGGAVKVLPTFPPGDAVSFTACLFIAHK